MTTRKTLRVNHDYNLFLGLDVGKSDHHAVGLDPTGRKLHDAPLPNSEPKLLAMFDKLPARGRFWSWSWSTSPTQSARSW